MNNMFNGATAFNQDISSWNIKNIGNYSSDEEYCWELNYGYGIELQKMFYNATSFDKSIGDWDVSNIRHMEDMFYGVTLSTSNYDDILIKWSQLSLQNNVEFNAGDSKYSSDAKDARQYIIDTYNWTIIDGGEE